MMPRHRTPHHTDGRGIGKKLKGSKLAERLAQLANEANTHHRLFQEQWRGMLLHAKQAGEALIEAKRRLGHRKKWSLWRQNNFKGSAEKARVYARIRREWDDPRIQQARSDGIEINSIKKFLAVLKGYSNTRMNVEQKERTERYNVRRAFNVRLNELTSDELEVLAGDGSDTFDGLWDRLRATLREYVQTVIGDVYEDEQAVQEVREKHQVRRRCLEAGKRHRSAHAENCGAMLGARDRIAPLFDDTLSKYKV